MELLSSGLAAFAIILLAELGDKSQIICLVLATRHRALPVFLGATLGFLVLTALAAALGAALDVWLPEAVLQFAVALLFAFFGIQMLFHASAADQQIEGQRSSHSIFLTSFLLIALSEMGDKTQIVVVGLSTVEPALGVFLGAQMALMTTSALGVWAGSRLLKREWLTYVHWIGAMLFLLFAALAACQGYRALD